MKMHDIQDKLSFKHMSDLERKNIIGIFNTKTSTN